VGALLQVAEADRSAGSTRRMIGVNGGRMVAPVGAGARTRETCCALFMLPISAAVDGSVTITT